MTASEETIINSHDVLNQLVLDVRTTEEVGRVSSIQIDPQTHQVLGLTCKLGLLGRKKNTLPFSLIQTFGKDSVLVQLSEDAELGLPESASSLIGHQLWTDAGHNAGKVVSYRFNAKTGAITDYLFVSNGWQGVADGVYQFPVSAITSVGPKRIIAADSVVKETEQYAPGLTQKMAQAADFLKEDYKQTQQDMAGAVRGGQNIFEQAKQKAGEVAGQVKQKAGELTEQAKDKTGQLQGKAQELAVQAKQKAGEVAEQAKDKAQELAAQAKDKAGELTEQAKDKT
ncbi:MAG: PRC-barrel domain-containing protein, partial [Microcoleaceae cyanobacterium]